MSVEKELDDFYFPQKELPNEILKDEENYKHLEGTINSKNIKNSEYIKPIIENNEEIGRIFLDKNKNEKYIEMFKNRKMNLLGISNNITFLHSFSKSEQQNYNPNEFIGFRYYENPKNKSAKFFTIIKKNYSKYFILEKNDGVKDINNNSFYDANLNCYDIIRKIFINKYKNIYIGNNGETFPEIVGYCVSLVTLSSKFFKFVEPLIANINTKNCIVDSIPEIINDYYTYVEPFIYDGHVSLILSAKAKDNIRYNIIFDMSHYHFQNNNPELIFLPKSLKEKNVIYPEKSIQEYSSCCLWLFGEIECLLKFTDKYTSFKDIYINLKKSIDFYIDIVNILSYEIEGVKCMIQKENKKYNEDNGENIDIDRIWTKKRNQYYSIHKDIVCDKFVNFEKLFFNNGTFIYYGEITKLSRCHYNIGCLYEYRSKLDLNFKYYDFLAQNNDVTEDMADLLQFSQVIDELIDSFKKYYDLAFYQANIFSFIGEIKDFTIILNKLDYQKRKRVYDFSFENFMSTTSNNYSLNKSQIENRLRLFSDETISKEINSLNNICFSIMNK